jgi:hypothetical protein
VKSIPRKYRVAAIAALTIIAFSAAALAQNAMPASSVPEDDNANSATAMRDTVHDPQIAAAKGGSWSMWGEHRPHGPMNAAFDSHDPIGVAAGKLIPADCSYNWTDPDTHQIFCFSDQASFVYFLAAPKGNEARAEKAWRALKGAS